MLSKPASGVVYTLQSTYNFFLSFYLCLDHNLHSFQYGLCGLRCLPQHISHALCTTAINQKTGPRICMGLCSL